MFVVLSQEGIDIFIYFFKGNVEAELMSIVLIFYVFYYLEVGNNWNIFFFDLLIKKQYLKKKLKEGKKNFYFIYGI